MQTALVNGRVLTDAGFAEDVAVIVEDDTIIDIAPRKKLKMKRQHDLQGHILAPGFVDCQVNGGGGVLFNDAPTVETVARIARAHRRFGTTGILPTLISDDVGVMTQAIDAVATARKQRIPGIIGIHLEGPFLSRGKKGIHDAAKFRTPDATDVDLIASLRAGPTLLTVAPEEIPIDVLRELAQRDVVVAAGHTAATYDQIRTALDAGLRGFTHLYNAMSPLQGREPGAVGAALDDVDSFCGIIVDGHHVHAASLRIALRAKPRGKMFLVTDAMPPVGSDQPTFQLNGETITCRDGLCTNEAGTLAGSALDMATAVRNCVAWLGVDLPEALRMASRYAADFVGVGHLYGRVAPGYVADLIEMTDDVGIVTTWCSGVAMTH